MSKTIWRSTKERTSLQLVISHEPRIPLNKFGSQPINLETWRELRKKIKLAEDNCLFIKPSVQTWELNRQGHPLARRITADFKEGFMALNEGNNF